MLGCASCRYIALRFQYDRLFPENRALDADVFVCFEPDVLAEDKPRAFHISRFDEDVFSVERACILQGFLGLDDDVFRKRRSLLFLHFLPIVLLLNFHKKQSFVLFLRQSPVQTRERSAVL